MRGRTPAARLVRPKNDEMSERPMQQWTEKDFDKLSWHDCHVHALAMREGHEEYGDGTLVLDIDFILEWLRTPEGHYGFRVAPATLEFFEIDDLEASFGYSGCAMGPFSIDGIERKLEFESGDFRRYRYSMAIQAPMTGFLRFSGNRLRQTLRGESVHSEYQSLRSRLRPPFVVGP
jgi:hypothetical protein